MKERTKLILGVIVLSVLIPAIVVGVFLWDRTREQRLETRAQQALAQGDAEKAQDLAAQAGDETLRFEAIYKSAEQQLMNGQYEEAALAFASLGDYRDAQSRVLACRYAAAEALEQAGEDAESADAFFALVPYADSLERYRACRYRIAEKLLSEGDSRAAFHEFAALIPYGDTEVRATEIAVQLTGETDPKKAVAFAKGYSEADWDRIEQVAAARSALTSGRIAVGNAHAAFLFSDGHVEAVGDGEQGQCNVAAFRDITAIGAGYCHTIGLKSDGTVVATGDNSCGQCETGDWTDVVSIACGAWDSYGIRADGTLLHCGFASFDLSGWTELLSVRACETALIGVRRDGTLLCTAEAGRFTGAYVDAAITTGAAFALTEEGTVRCENDDVAAWTDVIAINNSASVLIGVCVDGTLAVRPLMPCDAEYLRALSAQQNVAEVAPGGAFALVLHRDGTLSGCGRLPQTVSAFLANEPAL